MGPSLARRQRTRGSSSIAIRCRNCASASAARAVSGSGSGAQVLGIQRDRERVVDLGGPASALARESGPVDLVAGDDLAQRLRQGRDVELAVQPDDRLELVGHGGRVEVAEEADLLLRDRYGRRRRPRLRDQSAERRARTTWPGRARSPARERRGSRRVEQDVQREPRRRFPHRAGRSPRDEQGIAAELEEPVVATHAVDAQDLGEHIGDPALELIASAACGACAHLSTARPSASGSAARSTLLFWRQRQGVEQHPGCGDHVRGQPLGPRSRGDRRRRVSPARRNTPRVACGPLGPPGRRRRNRRSRRDRAGPPRSRPARSGSRES